LALVWPWNEGQGPIWNMNFITSVEIIHAKNELHNHINIGHSNLPQTNLQKDLILFCSLVALNSSRFLKIKVFLLVFHFLFRKKFRFSEPFKQISKRPTQCTFLQKICFLGIIVWDL
jgi:hypothetical protein